MAKKKLLPGFRYEQREGEKRQVKDVVNNGEVHYEGENFYAYNNNGHYLGFSPSLDEAEFMARNGYHNVTDEASELSTWTMWNDSVNSGVTILEDKETKEQFLVLPSKMVMVVRDEETGWDVDFWTYANFWDAFKDAQYDVLKLTVAEKPFVLE